MDTKSLNLGRKVLVDVVSGIIAEAARHTSNRVDSILMTRISKSDLDERFEIVNLGRGYARMQVYPIGLRIYALPDSASFKHPQIQRILKDMSFLKQHGIHVYDHGHISSANLYCVFTNEQGCVIPNEVQN